MVAWLSCVSYGNQEPNREGFEHDMIGAKISAVSVAWVLDRLKLNTSQVGPKYEEMDIYYLFLSIKTVIFIQ